MTQAVGSSSESPYFCDTNDHYAQDCTPCPRFAHCEKGQLKYCDAGYIKQDDECILNAKIDLLANKMLKFLKKELAAGNGELLCKQQEKKAQIRVDEIAQIVSKNFKKNANFEEALLLLLTKMDVPEEHGLLKSVDSDYNRVIFTEEVDLTLACRVRLFYNRYKFFIALYLLLLLVILYYVVKYLREKKYQQKAEEKYKRVLEKLMKEGVTALKPKTLLYEDDQSYENWERELILRFMDQIRKKDEQVGTFVQSGDVYWVPI